MVKSALVGLFGRSPFKPMQEHMEVVERCAAELEPLFAALAAGDFAAIAEVRARIDKLEHRADKVKHELRSHLPKSLFMPVDRRDLLEILSAQDSIADVVQDIAGLLVLGRLEIPPGMEGLLLEMVQRSCAAVRQAQAIINELDELLEMGFGGREADRVEAMSVELGAIESETDDQGLELVKLLLAAEESLKPSGFFLWHRLIELLGDVADHAEDVGDRLRLLTAR